MTLKPWTVLLCGLTMTGCFDYGGGGGGGAGGGPGGGAGGTQDVSSAFAAALSIPGSTRTNGPMGQGDAGFVGPTVVVTPGAPALEVKLTASDAGSASGSSTVSLSIPWQGGGVGSVNIGFGSGTAPPTSFFSVPTPSAAGVSSGMISVMAQIQNNFCAGLSVQNVCHQIQCYEQVVTPAGTFTKASALQMVINCTGQDCNGNPVTPMDGGLTCNNLQTSGGDVPETHTVELGRSSGSFAFSWDMRSQMDQMTVQYQGQTLFDTGCVAGTGTQTIPFSGTATSITVLVTPNCQTPGTGTVWSFTVGCP